MRCDLHQRNQGKNNFDLFGNYEKFNGKLQVNLMITSQLSSNYLVNKKIKFGTRRKLQMHLAIVETISYFLVEIFQREMHYIIEINHFFDLFFSIQLISKILQKIGPTF